MCTSSLKIGRSLLVASFSLGLNGCIMDIIESDETCPCNGDNYYIENDCSGWEDDWDAPDNDQPVDVDTGVDTGWDSESVEDTDTGVVDTESEGGGTEMADTDAPDTGSVDTGAVDTDVTDTDVVDTDAVDVPDTDVQTFWEEYGCDQVPGDDPCGQTVCNSIEDYQTLLDYCDAQGTCQGQA